jgi:hypothetical protein
VFGGTQDNGSPGFNGTSWANVNNGDGGFNDIDPTNPNIWYTSNTDVSVQRCNKTPASSCTFADFPLIVDNIAKSQGGNNNIPDASSFYTPFMLDPRDPHKVIIGTCRVWRGSSSDPTAWPGTNNANALSFNLDSGTAVACAGNDVMITALAAGGAAAPSGASAVIYAGREDGRIFVSTTAESGQSSFMERSISAATGGCPFNVQNNSTSIQTFTGCKISSIVVDPSDSTGNTAVATVMGFGVGHVFRTTTAGLSWSDITGNLPDAPADSIVIDAFDPTHFFVGTDTGVFETTNTGSVWASFGTGLPSVPITRLLLSDATNPRELRASTYGRGIWQAALSSPVAFFAFQAPTGNGQTIAAGQTATYNLNISSINAFAGTVNFSCAGAPGGSTCTVNPTSTTLTATSTNVPVTVTVTNTQNAGTRPSPFRGWPLVFAAVLAGVLIGAVRKPRQALPAALALFLVAAMLSCGGGGNGGGTPTPTPTPKPNTNVALSLTGTSGGLTRSFSLDLTVTH